MKERYEWREINHSLNWWGLWDKVMRMYVIETTAVGMARYKEFFKMEDK